MKKLTAEEFARLSKEEKDKRYTDLADGEMSRYRLLYDIPVPKPIDNYIQTEMTDEEIRESGEAMIRAIKFFEGTISKEAEAEIREHAEERIRKKENKKNKKHE